MAGRLQRICRDCEDRVANCKDECVIWKMISDMQSIENRVRKAENRRKGDLIGYETERSRRIKKQTERAKRH